METTISALTFLIFVHRNSRIVRDGRGNIGVSDRGEREHNARVEGARSGIRTVDVSGNHDLGSPERADALQNHALNNTPSTASGSDSCFAAHVGVVVEATTAKTFCGIVG